MENTSDNVADVAKVLAEHYQKTFDLTYELWMQRNRTFLVLLGVIGVATLLTFRTPEANSPLVGWVAVIIGATDPQQNQ